MSTPSAEKSDPALWKRIVAKVRRGTKGGDAGEWSARKAQLATAEYQKAGGGYAGGRKEDTHSGAVGRGAPGRRGKAGRQAQGCPREGQGRPGEARISWGEGQAGPEAGSRWSPSSARW
jgi:hypothetical protein